MKKTIKHAVKVWLFAASCVGIFTIFGDGWWKLIGVLSVLYMLATTITTWIDESSEENGNEWWKS